MMPISIPNPTFADSQDPDLERRGEWPTSCKDILKSDDEDNNKGLNLMFKLE
jgi:hypothetical protein